MVKEFGYITTEYTTDFINGKSNILTVFSYVFKDENNDIILFDTGSPTQKDILLKKLKDIFGASKHDIKWVFNTHLHIDHTGLNNHLPETKIIFSGKEFYNYKALADIAANNGNLFNYIISKWPGYKGRFTKQGAEFLKKELEKHWPSESAINDYNIEFIENKPEIPDYITILPAPGHTFNHYMFRIKTGFKDFLITGDAVCNRLEYIYTDDEGEYEPQEDTKIFLETKNEIYKLKNIIIAPGHDRPFYTNTMKGLRKEKYSIEDLKDM